MFEVDGMNSVPEFEVARIVNALKGSSSSGPDKIPTRVTRAVPPAILSPLTKLVNLSFEKGIFPESLKRACSQASGMFSRFFFFLLLVVAYCIPHKYIACKLLYVIAYIEFIACIIISFSYPPCIPDHEAFQGELCVL